MPTSFFLQQAALQNAESYFWQVIVGLVLAIVPALFTFFLMRRQQIATVHSTEAGTIRLQAETAALMVRDYDEIMAKLRGLHGAVMLLEREKHEQARLIERLRAGEKA